jgi:predicted nucleic acid-binding protein
MFLLRLDERLLDDAAALDPFVLRGHDAIHLAAAQAVRDSIKEFVTYDRRLAGAAKQLGFTVVVPGARVAE